MAKQSVAEWSKASSEKLSSIHEVCGSIPGDSYIFDALSLLRLLHVVCKNLFFCERKGERSEAFLSQEKVPAAGGTLREPNGEILGTLEQHLGLPLRFQDFCRNPI